MQVAQCGGCCGRWAVLVVRFIGSIDRFVGAINRLTNFTFCSIALSFVSRGLGSIYSISQRMRPKANRHQMSPPLLPVLPTSSSLHAPYMSLANRSCCKQLVTCALFSGLQFFSVFLFRYAKVKIRRVAMSSVAFALNFISCYKQGVRRGIKRRWRGK